MRQGFSLVEVAIGLLLVGAVATILLALATALRSGGETGNLQGPLLGLASLAESEASLPPCPSTQSLTLGESAYEACQQRRSEAVGSLERQIGTLQIWKGGSLAGVLVRVEVASSTPVVPGTCSTGNRRQVYLDLGAVGRVFTHFSLSWSPPTPASQRLRRIQQLLPMLPLWTGSYASGSGYQSLDLPLSLLTPNRILLTFSRNFPRGTNYTFDLRFRDASGNEFRVTPCTVVW